MNNYEDIYKKVDNMKTVVAIYYNSELDSFDFIPLNIKKEEYIKESFPLYNEKSTPFIYKETNYRILISDTTKDFILTRNGFTDDRPYINVFEKDLYIAKELLRMQNRKEELDI